MQYRMDRNQNPLSVLAYGCMRFEKRGMGYDLQKAERDIMCAIEGGITYFDTAYIYANSEEVLGTVLERNHCRDKVKIATKLPHYLIGSKARLEKLFQTELERLKTDYIDYYLMHMLTDVVTWEKLCEMGILEWIAEKKASGQIRHIGFSYHGNSAMFCKLVDIYDWDFCMIQYNYMDEFSQAGKIGLQHASKKGLPVMIMEPLRGGRLVNMLPAKAKKLIAEHPSGRSAAEWGLRWLWNQPEVTCVLSGMFGTEMVKENIRIAETAHVGDFTDEDFAFIEQIKSIIKETQQVGCTGCGYCMPCPAGVDIPGAFSCHNAMYAESKASGRKDYLKSSVFRKHPSSASQCVGCGKCTKHCPQNIDIPAQLSLAAKDLEDTKYKIAKWGIKTLRLWK